MSSGVLLSLAVICLPAFAATPREEIEIVNQRLREATLHMDNAATMELWAEDGVTLLPGLAPIEGKRTIARWLDGVVANLHGYRVTAQDNVFHDVQISGDWASEWGTTHQVVQPPNGGQPMETWGKILLVLHRDAGGAWKIREEMWTPGVKPQHTGQLTMPRRPWLALPVSRCPSASLRPACCRSTSDSRRRTAPSAVRSRC